MRDLPERYYARIASAANCTNTNAGTHYNYFEKGKPVTYSPVFDRGTWGGFVQAATDESGFNMLCPTLPGAGSAVEIAVGPTISPPTTPPNWMGCGSTDTWTWQYSSYNSLGQFPPQILTYSQTTPSSLLCAMYDHPNIGDAKVYSYRSAGSISDFTL